MTDPSEATQALGRSTARRPEWSVSPKAMFGVILLVVLTAVNAAVLLATHAQHDEYYLALGDSISFGLQMNGKETDGLYNDILTDLKGDTQSGSTRVVITKGFDLGCPSETTTSMLEGECPHAPLVHSHCVTGAGAQIDDAVGCLKRYGVQVQLITLSIGASDVEQDWDRQNCKVKDPDKAFTDLTAVDIWLPVILARLRSALSDEREVYLLNYYNPWAQDACVQSTSTPILPAPKLPGRCMQSSSNSTLFTPKRVTFMYVECLNQILAFHASHAGRAVKVVPVFEAFGGEAMGDAGNMVLCTLTWNCDQAHQDIHPNDKGYRLIASVVERSLPLPSSNPLNLLALTSGSAKRGKLEEQA